MLTSGKLNTARSLFDGVEVSSVGIATMAQVLEHLPAHISSHTAVIFEVPDLDADQMVDVSVDVLNYVEKVANAVGPVFKVLF